MAITYMTAGSRTRDEIFAEVVAFDTIINEASGLGADFDPRSDEVHQELVSDNDQVTHQTQIGRLGGAIVAREPRGHGLAPALKIAYNMAMGVHTGVERIYTWNEMEDSWMLVTNDRAGIATGA